MSTFEFPLNASCQVALSGAIPAFFQAMSISVWILKHRVPGCPVQLPVPVVASTTFELVSHTPRYTAPHSSSETYSIIRPRISTKVGAFPLPSPLGEAQGGLRDLLSGMIPKAPPVIRAPPLVVLNSLPITAESVVNIA